MGGGYNTLVDHGASNTHREKEPGLRRFVERIRTTAREVTKGIFFTSAAEKKDAFYYYRWQMVRERRAESTPWELKIGEKEVRTNCK